MELSALTQFISNVAMALDAGYDLPLEETKGHIERGDFIRCLTDLCGADADLMGHLFREHWTAATERELVELLRDASTDERVASSFQRSGLCYLIALAAQAAIRF
jgi:hypothetical protein